MLPQPSSSYPSYPEHIPTPINGLDYSALDPMPVAVPAGTAQIFTQSLLHTAWHNSTPEPRKGFIISWCAAEVGIGFERGRVEGMRENFAKLVRFSSSFDLVTFRCLQIVRCCFFGVVQMLNSFSRCPFYRRRSSSPLRPLLLLLHLAADPAGGAGSTLPWRRCARAVSASSRPEMISCTSPPIMTPAGPVRNTKPQH